MTTRNKLTQPVATRNAVLTIGSALVIATLTAFGRIVAQSKLDTPRFVAESITTHFNLQDLRSEVHRHDSVNSQNILRVCKAVRGGC